VNEAAVAAPKLFNEVGSAGAQSDSLIFPRRSKMLSPGFVLAATAATRTENKKKANNKHVLILLLLYRRNVSFSFFYI
jgi:hypothetical protein